MIRESRPSAASTASPEEIARFAGLADAWWDPAGKFKPLHRLNPVRVRFIRDRLAAQRGRNPEAPEPLRGLSILDIGCGGGLLAEPLARLGAEVTGIDAAEDPAGDVKVFHAGTKLAGGQPITSGGRVLNVCAMGKSLKDAQQKANAACDKIHFDGAFYRHDIGSRVMK